MNDTTEIDAPTPGQRCPLSGHVASVTREEWIESETATCHYCGGVTRIGVRATDLSPWARFLTHRVPRVTSPEPPGSSS